MIASRQRLPYSLRSQLNTVDIYLPAQYQSHQSSEPRFWIVYIHGGAWRDPDIQASSVNATQDLLVRSAAQDHIRGIASINYRLSPHADFPEITDKSGRCARHPDHLNDVLDALRFLTTNFDLSTDGYILTGHSCGATLAFQACNNLGEFPQPVAVIGLCGLYDLPSLVTQHAQESIYYDFVSSAFGADHDVWRQASPASFDFSKSSWGGVLLVLAYSVHDQLVEQEQTDSLKRCLQYHGWVEALSSPRRFKMIQMKGDHDQIWSEGQAAAGAIIACIECLKQG